jgi:hypothetical protein
MKHKFKVGDKVKVVRCGHGIPSLDMGKIVTISHLMAIDYNLDEPAYWIEEKIGNCNTPYTERGYGIGETSFELVKEIESISLEEYLKEKHGF